MAFYLQFDSCRFSCSPISELWASRDLCEGVMSRGQWTAYSRTEMVSDHLPILRNEIINGHGNPSFGCRPRAWRDHTSPRLLVQPGRPPAERTISNNIVITKSHGHKIP